MLSQVVCEDMENIYNRNIEWTRLYKKSILVTGATGMLASYLVYFFIYLNEEKDAGIKIYSLVRNLEKCKKVFGEYVERDYFFVVEQDITDKIILNADMDFVVQAAGAANPEFYKTNPVEVAASNVIGTYNLLDWAKRGQQRWHHKIRVLYFSSGDIYGKMPDNTGDITESMMGIMDPLDEHSCYGESKRMSETLCSAFCREHGIPIMIVRIGHTYAPTMDIDKDPRVFASFMKCVFNGKDIVMLSDGKARRPFCYIADAIAAYMLVLLEGVPGEAYNVCNTKDFLSIAELAEILISLRPELGLKIIRKERPSTDNYLEIRINKANKPIETKLKMLGWECKYNAKQGFERVLRYLQDKSKGKGM